MRVALPTVVLFMLAGCKAGHGDSDRAIDQLMSAYQGKVPGASVLVVRDGRVLVRRSYGLADIEDHVAATPATSYRLASVTKQFTAAAILLLAQDKALSLDDPIRKWLPTLPDAATSITIRQLLTHTSGLIDYEDVIPAGTSQQLHDSDVLHLLEAQDQTYFPPGTHYRYSDSGCRKAGDTPCQIPGALIGWAWERCCFARHLPCACRAVPGYSPGNA
jgi:CubicO group peptidase (beta-lactamase class C family)